MAEQFTLVELHLHDGPRLGSPFGRSGDDGEREDGGGAIPKVVIALVALLVVVAVARKLRGGGDEDLADLDRLDEIAGR